MRKRLFVFAREFYRIFHSERILREAGSLTFVTVLGFVPFLLFLVTFFPDMPPLNLLDQVKTLLVSFLLPQSTELVLDFIDELFQYQMSLNIFNIAMLIITSFSLFNSITTSFDRILHIEQKPIQRSFNTLMKVFGMVILGFFIFTLLISTTSLPYFHSFFSLRIVNYIINYLLPLLFWFLLINVAYFFLPNAKIRIKYMLIAASISAVVWFATKLGFDFYIHNLTRMRQIYGLISSFPIFLFWIYLNWIFILSGVVIMSILTGLNNSPREFKLTAQISLSIDKKVYKDHIKEIQFSDDEEQQLRLFLADLLSQSKDLRPQRKEKKKDK